jgi:hypothetical protein
MAYGAYLAAKDAGREKNILFIGAHSDEAGHRFQIEAGQSFRFHSGR